MKSDSAWHLADLLFSPRTRSPMVGAFIRCRHLLWRPARARASSASVVSSKLSFSSIRLFQEPRAVEQCAPEACDFGPQFSQHLVGKKVRGREPDNVPCSRVNKE
jgi:hypothetical protein